MVRSLDETMFACLQCLKRTILFKFIVISLALSVYVLNGRPDESRWICIILMYNMVVFFHNNIYSVPCTALHSTAGVYQILYENYPILCWSTCLKLHSNVEHKNACITLIGWQSLSVRSNIWTSVWLLSTSFSGEQSSKKISLWEPKTNKLTNT